MDIFDGLTALGGLCLFLFGMQIMAEALQRLRHNLHTEQKQAQSAQGGQSVKNVHARLLSPLACPAAVPLNRCQSAKYRWSVIPRRPA